MFGDENQNKLAINSSMKIAIVDNEGTENELINMIFETINKEYLDRLKISYIYNISDLYKNSLQNLDEKSEGLLNSQWIEEISTLRPSVIILYYYIKEGSSKEEEEIKISKIIDNILIKDKYVYIYLFVIVPQQELDIYQHLKDDEKSPNSLRKKLNKEFIYIFPSKEIWNTIELSKLCNSLILCSRNYYKQLKVAIGNKKNESMHAEEIIKYDILMGILSTIKSKKQEICVSKHLKEAYDIICTKSFDHKKYLYGKPESTKLNFCEIRAIADWLLFKIMKLNFKVTENFFENKKKNSKMVVKQKNLDVKTKIDIFYNHIRIFSSFDYGDKEKEGDPFYFYNYWWTLKRYENLIEFYEENINELREEQKYIYKIGLNHFYIFYILMKMIKFYKRFFSNIDLTKVKVKDKKISMNLIDTIHNKYYAKPPKYCYNNPDTGKSEYIGYNDDIYLKKFIVNNDLTLDKMLDKLKNEIIPKVLSFYQKTCVYQRRKYTAGNKLSVTKLTKSIKENSIKGLEIYLNMLKLKALQIEEEINVFEIPNITDTMIDLYKSIEKTSNIKKFPTIYYNFLNRFTESLIYQMENHSESNDNIRKTSLFKSLTFLATIKLLNEKEQNIYNQLLNDESFIPVKDDNKKIVQEDFINENQKEQKEEDIEKTIEKNYIKKDDIVINICNKNKLLTNQNNSFGFDYNIKDIDKSQERKIMDLVEYEFKISTKCEKFKFKFDNIKIFFICINEETDSLKNQNKKEIIMREYTSEELSSCELSYDKPLLLEHKIFLKYKKGKMYASKVMATLSQKKNIIFLFDIPNEFNNVIFIKNLSKTVLNFDYRKNFKVGKNQIVPFEINITKEIIDEVEIEDLNIQFETIPIMIFNDFSSFVVTAPKKELESNPKEEITPEQFSSSLGFGQQRISVRNNQKEKVIQEDNMIDVRNSCRPNFFKHSSSKIFENPEKSNIINQTALDKINLMKKNNSPLISVRTNNYDSKLNFSPPEFYIYNETNNSLEQYIDKFEKKYNNFERLLKEGKNKYTTLLKFSHEGNYKIKFAIVYYIRHKKIEEYIEYTEESILEFNVVKPFTKINNINSTIFQRNEEKKKTTKEEEKIYLTNTKIGMYINLANRIEEDIRIKDIQYELKNEQPIKYINSYINDLIHSYDLDEEEKKEILLIKKNSSFNFPFEIEFAKAFKDSIGKMKIIWTTKSLEEYEEGKFNLLNEDVFDFSPIEIKRLDLDIIYNTEMKENNKILLDIKIRNITNKSKLIVISLSNAEENKENGGFIIIGIPRQTRIIKEKEVINIRYTLIPVKRGEFEYPYIKIVEKDFLTKDKIYSNYYLPDKIAII